MEEAALTRRQPAATGNHAFVERPSYKWWVTWTIMLGAFLFALDTTIVNIAIPKIMTSIGADLQSRKEATRGNCRQGTACTSAFKKCPLMFRRLCVTLASEA